MSDPTGQQPESDPLPEGLIEFYSSEAEVALAQYKNINRLLGKTTHHTHPGTLCEVLIRDLLRRNVLKRMAVDKGYVYGRSTRADGKEDHSPEIDILIHDTQDHRPLFRLDDFVIVQPDAAIGFIQVKRRLRSDRLAKGIENVAEAKRHTLEKRLRKVNPNYRAFSAVIGFAKNDREDEAASIRAKLMDAAEKYRPMMSHWRGGHEPSTSLLPQFVGSLQGYYAVSHDLVVPNTKDRLTQNYCIYNSVHEGRNVALQHLLVMLTHTLWGPSGVAPPFAAPKGMTPAQFVSLDFGEFKWKPPEQA